MSANETAEAILIVIKRLLKWFGFGVLILAGLVLLIVAGASGYDKWQSRPQIATELNGIKLGESIGDVRFKNEGLSGPSKWADKNSDQQNYSIQSKLLFVSVKGGRVNRVSQLCGTSSDHVGINRIYCNESTSEDILKKYGSNVRVLCVKDEPLKRAYDAIEFGVRYELSQNTVYAITITSPEALETSKVNLQPCE